MGSDGKPAKLVLVRNPWGSYEWKGDFSDNSHLWTKQAKQHLKTTLNWEPSDDGTFFMTVQDFCKHFKIFFQCKYVDNYQFSYLLLPIIEKEAVMSKMIIYESGVYTIGLSQKDSRCFKETSSYNYASCRVVIAH